MQTYPPPVRVETNLVENVVSLGEPIVLRYMFIGTQAERVSLSMTRKKMEWLTLTLNDTQGHAVPPVPDLRLPEGGMYSGGIGVDAANPAVEYVVVSRLLRPTYPSDYWLSSRIHIPYALESQSRNIPSSRWEKTFGTVLTQEDVFPLTITPLDPARLRRVAEGLAEVAAQDGDRVRGTVALQSLFSMPEEYVLPVWQSVATSENPHLLNRWGVISDELARVQSIGTADILMGMAWHPPPAVQDLLNVKTPGFPGFNFNSMAANNVPMKFHNLYFTADPPLKQHLTELFIAHDGEVPQKPILIID